MKLDLGNRYVVCGCILRGIAAFGHWCPRGHCLFAASGLSHTADRFQLKEQSLSLPRMACHLCQLHYATLVLTAMHPLPQRGQGGVDTDKNGLTYTLAVTH
jgi:hypothetical protein